MVGLLIITHCRLAQELLEAAEFILGSIEAVDVVLIDTSKDSDTLRDLIEKKIQSLDRGKGVLVLTDMFGGTPSNLALSFLQRFMNCSKFFQHMPEDFRITFLHNFLFDFLRR